ncbi:hypothetical protein PFICI_09524 [Pestalotiopsis fici W106-1]|uniref:Uncharacterized protein n=1 Tax=Pestalotiopsis fici (strain W106-1 / CGMCC3.15140) TaxID=1229662 RepID=W3X3F3_PESFW|nr:uncharacterized protein PFICI_09524 [Pestalotiopsis fici W106-1]ETS79671.1 hypothetical protein PFICI_09524 [Pestalotiopsis fici W106-1]
MPDGIDLESFLQHGYWQNSRVKTTDTRDNTSSYSYNNTSIPRSSHSTEYPPELRRRSFYPPSPSVEDESASIAKEYGSILSAYPDEEPRYPGDPDQLPIISGPLYEHNPEQRFVFLGPSSSSTSDEDTTELKNNDSQKRSVDDTEKPPLTKGKERAPDREEKNDCQKFVLVASDGEKEKLSSRPETEERSKRPIRERRKSRLEDLPTIITDLDRDGHGESRQKDIRRSRSANGRETGNDDYFSPRRSSQRYPNESLLSPDVTKHSTKGRDRTYYDYSGPNSPSQGRSRAHGDDHPGERRHSRRPDDTLDRPYSAGPVESRNPETSRSARKVAQEGSTGRESRDALNEKHRQNGDRPANVDRTDSLSSTNRPDRESLKPRSLSFRGKRESDDSRFSSEEEVDRRPTPRQRVKSFVHEERSGHLQTPTEPKPLGRRSKPSTPLASPRVSQGELFPNRTEYNERRNSRSATFPMNVGRENSKPEGRFRTEDDLSRPVSRTSTAKSSLSSAVPLAVPVLTAVAAAAAVAAKEPGSPADRKPSGIPPSQKPVPQKARVSADEKPDSRSSSLTPSSSTTSKRDWEPPKFDPYKDGVHDDKPNASYRRYSEGHKGSLPDLPECPRTNPQTHHVDWLTLPKCDHFNICPSCVSTAFANTEWQKSFVLPPFRATDKPLKCDFGASPWYHIAWLLMHKNQIPDLGMFQGLNNVTRDHQPCSGNQEAIRIWYTIKDPETRRPVRNFKVCHHCAKSIETLLPSLKGVFVPVGQPGETSRGICSMRKQNHAGAGRDRFVVLFDQMETTSDLALASKRSPDVHALANKVRKICSLDECYGGQPVRDRKWFSMRSMPYFTVCEECYEDVIWPEIERGASNVKAEFYNHSQRLDTAACQLYSDRMRRYFRDAVKNDDLEYLKSKIARRRQKEQEFYDSIRSIDADAAARGWDRERVDDEIERAKREWRRHE